MGSRFVRGGVKEGCGWLGQCEGERISRCALKRFTPAFGRAVRVFDPSFLMPGLKSPAYPIKAAVALDRPAS